MKLEFNGPAGSQQTMVVTLTNPTDRVLEASATLADWDRDSLGDIRVYPAGTTPASCAPQIKLFPSPHVSIPPGEHRDLTLMMDLQKDTLSSLANCMLFVTQTNPMGGKDKNGVSIQLTVRVGIQVFYTPPGIYKKDIDIVDFRDGPDTAASRVLWLTLQNKGGLEADGKVGWELTNLETGKKTELDASRFYTLPGARRVLRMPLGADLPRGKYSMTALVDFGQDQELKLGVLEFSYEGGR